MKKHVFSVDFDGVLCNLGDSWLEYINNKKGTNYSTKDIKSYGTPIFMDNFDFILQEDLYSKVPLFEGADDFMFELQKLGEVQIVTHSFEESIKVKDEFIFENFPYCKVIHTNSHNKEEFTKDTFVIEDRKEFFYTHNTLGVIFSNNNKHLYNRITNEDYGKFSCNVVRLSSYKEILEYIKNY